MTEVIGERDQEEPAGSPTGDTASTPRAHLGAYPVRLPSVRDPRMHLAVVTTTLQVLGQTTFDFNVSIAQILVTVAACGLIDFTVTLRRDHTIAWPASGLLTGNGIALILRVPTTEHGDWWSLQGWWIFVGAGALAMASKYLIRVHGRHVFNPSNFALVVVFVVLGENRVDPQVLWWGPLSPGLVLAFAVILAGSVVITRRVGQGASALSFWAVFAAAVALIAATGHSITARWHVGGISGWDYWVLLVTSPEVLVFLFFMITDPRTAPSQRRGQVAYGTSIAVVGALIIATQSGEFGTKVGILAGLTLVSPFVGLIRARSPEWTATRRFGLRVGGVVGISLAAVVLLASATGDGALQVATGTDRRAEFPVDMGTLPKVAIDPGVEQFSVELDQSAADRLAQDVVQDLMMEAAALETGDVALAGEAVASGRFSAVESAIASTAAGSEPIDYRIDSLEAVVVQPSSGPQAPPVLAVRVTGELSVGATTEELDGIYLTRENDGVHLITGAVSPSGERLTPPVSGTVSTDGSDVLELPEAPPNPPGVIPPPWEPGDPALGSLRFTEVSDSAGLGEPYATVPLTDDEGMSSGVAAADIDNDADIDLFVPRFGKPDALFLNDGNGRFQDVAEGAGVEGPDDGQGSATGAFADVNGDRYMDLVVIGSGRRSNRLYMNNGDNTFTDETSERGVPSPDLVDSNDANQMHDVAVADVNGDGALDLLLLHWWNTLNEGDPAVDTVEAEVSVQGHEVLDHSGCARSTVLRDAGFPVDDDAEPNRSALLLNDGEGNFSDATDEYRLPLDEIVAFTGEFNDLDGDGWQDLAVTGDYCTSRLFRNIGGRYFEDVTRNAGVATAENAMGSVIRDINGDGLADWLVSSISYPSDDPPPLASGSGNRVYLNRGDMTFEDATDALGLRDAGWAWGAAVEDFDNDGTPEVAMTNGYESNLFRSDAEVPDWAREFFSTFRQDRTRFWYRDGEVYRDAAAAVGIDDTTVGHGLVTFDMDSDGDLDLLITPSDAPPRLYRNDTSNENHWLTLGLHDPTEPGNRWGDGARIEVTPAAGDAPLVGWISTGGSYESQKPPLFHVGLGNHEGPVDRVEVFWTGEDRPQVLTDVEADQQLTVRRSR